MRLEKTISLQLLLKRMIYYMDVLAFMTVRGVTYASFDFINLWLDFCGHVEVQKDALIRRSYTDANRGRSQRYLPTYGLCWKRRGKRL